MVRARIVPRRVLLLAAFLIGISHAARSETSPDADAASSAIAGNPGAVNIVAGTGGLGRQRPGTTSFNNLLVADFDAVAPTRRLYVSLSGCDGNTARGEQTGLEVAPIFNGYRFQIGETGAAWAGQPARSLRHWRLDIFT